MVMLAAHCQCWLTHWWGLDWSTEADAICVSMRMVIMALDVQAYNGLADASTVSIHLLTYNTVYRLLLLNEVRTATFAGLNIE